jgi:hypothetical protein
MPAPPAQLFLRPTVIAGDRLEDDYQVIWDGIPIGRILKQPGVPFGRPNWSWGVIFPHMPQQAWHRGLESSLEECQRRFKVVWSDIRRNLTETDIEAARVRSADNARRWKD